MSEWQPIETAPRDGAWVLGYDPVVCKEEQLMQVKWTGCWEHNDYDNLFYNPTHWMPLPDVPK